MKYLLLTIVLSIFSVTVSATCAEGYICRDTLSGREYYNEGGLKSYTDNQQIRTVSPGLLNAIANPPQNNIFANIQKFQAIQLQAAQIKAAKTPKSKPALTLQDIELALQRSAAQTQNMIELGKKYPEIQKLVDIANANK